MSILQTPPEERQPVLTFVGAYTDAQVSAAIRRELLRDGQVFYVHNRVDSISSVAAHISELVPEARVRTAHGKMNEHQLEAVIQDFWNHEFDVLVCTTIVETGLDISNANTLIVDRADTFGLSQLHQLRGRVGRGRERAYAYFFYPGDKALTETAHERLKTIAANTELGAGLAVAQRDLEIRGAGNLLGGAQSGHVEGVGFDLYVRMVSDAVAVYRGDAPTEKADVRMDLQVDAHIPEGYVRGERLRLEVYAKIAATTTPEQEKDVREELVDRYGPIPPQVDLLFAVARLREIVRRAGITESSRRQVPARLARRAAGLPGYAPQTPASGHGHQGRCPPGPRAAPAHLARRRVAAHRWPAPGVGGDAGDQDPRTFWRVVPVVEYTGPIASQHI